MSSPSARRRRSAPTLIVAIVCILGAIGVVINTANDLDLDNATASVGLNEEENAYYEYVAPRLDRLVTEVDDVVEMVESKSRDILSLTVSGNRIEDLTSQIIRFGESKSVPDRFSAIHQQIILATDTTTYTFGQAREALRTFDFSQMSDLVTGFQAAADELHDAQGDLEAIAGGTEDAMLPASVPTFTRQYLPPNA